MPLYPKQSPDMVCDLINLANPGMPIPVSRQNVSFGAPISLKPTGAIPKNTQVTVRSRGWGVYHGLRTLYYDRLDLTLLFRAMIITVNKHTNAGPSQIPFRMSELLGDINTTYGFNFTVDDINDVPFPIASDGALGPNIRTSQANLVASNTSLGFVGQVTVRWVNALPRLQDVVTVTNLENARTWPGGLNAVTSQKAASMVTYSGDYTTIFGRGAIYDSGAGLNPTVDNTTLWAQVLAAMGAVGPVTLNSTQANAGTYPCVYGFSFLQVDLSTLAGQQTAPTANAAEYNRCLILRPPANSWATDDIIIHYNYFN